ncbi:MAG: UDP-2,4-diacetamido-2,4,6-trideoxy-beta-L-altropyranose hydrolase [Bacteroidota bacterium]
MKKIIFRADGNANIGLGHLYRIFALVEMSKSNFEFVFLTRENSAISVIPKEYNIKLIPTTISLIEEPGWIYDFFFSEGTIVVADGYEFDSNYQKQIKNKGFKLIYIDDLSTEYMYADFVINHSPNIVKEDYTSEPYTKFALGLKYAILRPLFIEEAKNKRSIPLIMDTAFVCFGGSDSYNLTLKAVNSLLQIEQFIKINIVVGGAYEHNEVFQLAKENPRLKIYQNLSEKNLIQVMKESHFAIAPASTILLELCSVKMVILSGYYVKNQKKGFEGFVAKELVFGIGDLKNISIDNFKMEILKTINYNRDKLLKNQIVFFDGLQKDRFLEIFKAI